MSLTYSVEIKSCFFYTFCLPWDIFLKMEGIPTMYAAFVLVMLLLLAIMTESKFTTLNVVEGDVGFLNFTYSCNNTAVTIQRGTRHAGALLYNSKGPTPPLSSNVNLINETDGKVCFLYLTLNPVTKDDAGGYVLFAYRDDLTQVENYRIFLVVKYPPGKASCSLSEEHIDPNWVRLQCTASIGNIGGFMCYQNGVKIAPLYSPQQHDETLSQTFLARVRDLVYCCFITLDQTKDMCECKDTVWDPVQKKQVTNVTDLCPTVQYPPYPRQPISPGPKALTVTPPPFNSSNFFLGPILIICLLTLVIVILSAVLVFFLMKYRKGKERKKTKRFQSNESKDTCEL